MIVLLFRWRGFVIRDICSVVIRAGADLQLWLGLQIRANEVEIKI